MVLMHGCHRLNSFFLEGYFLLFCLIFSANSRIWTLPWSGVALLTVPVWSREVCVSAVPFPLSGWSFSVREVHGLGKSQLEPWWA